MYEVTGFVVSYLNKYTNRTVERPIYRVFNSLEAARKFVREVEDEAEDTDLVIRFKSNLALAQG